MHNNLQICLILASLAASTMSQYAVDAAMRPDMTFDNHNDRFDITSIIQDQNRNDDLQYRRFGEVSKENPIDAIRNSRSSKNNDFVFAEADTDSAEGGTVADFEHNLQKINAGSRRSLLDIVARLHSKAIAARRSAAVTPDPEQEILLQHAVPVQMNIHGFLQTPLVE